MKVVLKVVNVLGTTILQRDFPISRDGFLPGNAIGDAVFSEIASLLAAHQYGAKVELSFENEGE